MSHSHDDSPMILPHDLDAEEAVLGLEILNNYNADENQQ